MHGRHALLQLRADRPLLVLVRDCVGGGLLDRVAAAERVDFGGELVLLGAALGVGGVVAGALGTAEGGPQRTPALVPLQNSKNEGPPASVIS